jgi:hypothetical protein
MSSNNTKKKKKKKIMGENMSSFLRNSYNLHKILKKKKKKKKKKTLRSKSKNIISVKNMRNIFKHK